MPKKKKTEKKILIVEDEAPIGNALKLKLEHEGYEVEHALNGQLGLDACKKTAYDLILLDLIMPEVDGFGVLEGLKKQKNVSPVIISSNLSQDEDIKKAKSLGAVDYYVKSNTSISAIVEKVAAALQKK